MTKKILFYVFLFCSVVLAQSCSDDDSDVKTYAVSVDLAYPDGYSIQDSVTVTLTNSLDNSTYSAKTITGSVTFTVPSGTYSVSASDVQSDNGAAYNFNGTNNLTISSDWDSSTAVSLSLTMSKSSQLIIKELYNGGCQKDDGSGAYYYDSYVILYNNSDLNASLDNVCLGMAMPYNGHGSNDYYEDGVLTYANEGWIPAGQGIWYFPDGITLAPGKQIVVALKNAVDNTTTYSNSINFANAEYYCTYDIEEFTSTTYYPAPSSAIPTSHYLSGVRYGAGTAWVLSQASPAFFIFATDGVTPVDFANDANYSDFYSPTSTALVSKRVPTDWILDGIEVFKQGSDNLKRLTSAVDAGYVYLTAGYGYTLYRNVNQTATEALSENSGKIVYDYSGGTSDIADGSTDPSGIDAEASIANGARIIYMDTNTSTADFHERNKASLRD